MNDKESQRDELFALQSIYNEDEFQISEEEGESGGCFIANIDLPEDFVIVYRDWRHKDKAEEYEELKVTFLPPVILYFNLPCDYPSKSPPNYTLACKWLHRHQLSTLCKKLDQIWVENGSMEILFMWTGFLKEETLKFLEVHTKLDISHLYVRHLRFVERRNAKEARNVTVEVEGSKEERVVNVVHKPRGVDKGDYGPRGHGLGRGKRAGRFGWRPSASRYETFKLDSNDNRNTDLYGKSSETKMNMENLPKTFERKCNVTIFDTRAVLDLHPNISVISMLTDYDEHQKKTTFHKNVFTCKICFLDRQGLQCTRFDKCGHVFCKECIREYFQVQISDGNVRCLRCPEEKCDTDALPSQVKELVSPQVFERYDSILLNSTLDTMSDIMYCPRPSCHCPVILEPEEKMGKCPSCQYVFCIYCKMVYHGVEPCRYKSDEKQQLVREYQSATSEKKCHLEQRYGKKQLQALVDTVMSETWIQDNSKNCPHCNAAIEKSDGCNKMVCWNCNTFFCWLCHSRLNQQSPYLHFNNPASKCFNMLFYGVALDNDEDDDWEAGIFV